LGSKGGIFTIFFLIFEKNDLAKSGWFRSWDKLGYGKVEGRESAEWS
jgi:hypothetical protein